MSSVHHLLPKRFRAIWISDVHLGFKGCRADYLLDFLKSTESDYLYLVGDFIDMWSMRRNFFWPQSHNDVIRAVLGKAKRGTRVVYVPGNHDELLRDYDGMSFGDVLIRNEIVHTTADGRRLLILHGDAYDSVIRCSKLIESIGSWSYGWLLDVNRLVNWTRRKLGFPYWSLAAYLKHKVKNAVNYISSFETVVAHEACKHKVDGLVCGHIHHAEITKIGGVLYCNDGDWVESCTALVEHFDGALQLLHWADQQHVMKCEVELEADLALGRRAA